MRQARRDTVIDVVRYDDFFAYVQRFDNSDDAPCFGKMYGFFAIDPVTKKGYYAHNARFLSDELARKAFYEFFDNAVRVVAALEYVNSTEE